MNSKTSRRVLAQTVASKLLAEPQKRKHWIQALAAFLVENRRTDEIDMLVNDISRELFLQKGELVVDVTSARPLTDDIRRELAASLKRATGANDVQLTEAVDPSLLGGLIARTPDAQLDASVRSKLKQLATIK